MSLRLLATPLLAASLLLSTLSCSKREDAAPTLEFSFEGLNKAFYNGLRNYMLGVAGRSPRTFNTYIKRLRSFLFWAEELELPVPQHFRKTLQLAQSYVGKDALTQDELLSIAAIDFRSPAVQAYLATAFPEPPPYPAPLAAAVATP
jgi:hypothetical protein